MATISTDSSARVITLEQIRSPVIEDLKATDELIIKQLISPVTLVQQITRHILSSGGKRLRPLLVILAARAAGYADGQEHHDLAAIIEFVHTATLLHDDVVDESKQRRGQDTANAVWGNQASVLVGDFLYSRAFQLLTRRSNVPVMQVLANTTNAIAEGEILQLMNRHDPDINEDAYFDVIYRKTAKLFESSAEIGALLNNNNNQQQALAQYGKHLGMAFQIVDDLLDYSDSTTIGKNVGDDLAEGKMTLPLIYALQNTDNTSANTVRQAIQNGGLDQLPLILDIIQQTNAATYTLNVAKKHINAAKSSLDTLADSAYRQALIDLAEFVVARNY